jgi:hypothetical protein
MIPQSLLLALAQSAKRHTQNNRVSWNDVQNDPNIPWAAEEGVQKLRDTLRRFMEKNGNEDKSEN